MADKQPIQIPIEIDENNINESALKVLEILRPSWDKDKIKFKRFNEGIMNILTGCYLDGKFDEDVVLIRVYGKNTELTVDRQAENEVIRMLSKKGLCNDLYATLCNGTVYGFVHGETLDQDTVKDENIAKLIAKEMVKIHSIKPKGSYPKSVFLEKLYDWIKHVPDSFDDPEVQRRFEEHIKSTKALSKELDILRQELESMECPIVLCHNDLLLKNIIYNKQKDEVKFIDYEYAMPNFRAYDIGNHFCEYAGVDEIDYRHYPDKDYQLNWIRNYLTYWKEYNNEETDVTDKDLAHFFCGVWSLIQTKYSTIDFDYLTYSIMRFNEYFKRKDEFLSLQVSS
ncbi:hypothetical protein KUTeg_023061 [Tegillarca granosa]|uniref:ethanolamine kinase n=1 Tax=Tegillarca granosa TaxID=220873 RepID=A0ABQ9E0J6_TEGGR|nr:hypothetical protein KUTeg_023061 [Tegillarca granosa]